MSIKKNLDHILTTQTFEQLDRYRSPQTWESMSHDEKELFASLLVSHGEELLKNGDNKVTQNFTLASTILPNSPTILLQQAHAYITYAPNLNCLMEATKLLEKVIDKDPHNRDAWVRWGIALTKIGILYENGHYFHLADEKFAHAYHLFSSTEISQEKEKTLSNNNNDLAYLLWQWGVCRTQIAKYSGEAADFFIAKEKYTLAEELYQITKNNLARFYREFGHILEELGSLLKNKQLCMEATQYYKKATLIHSDSSDAWLDLAKAHQKLFFYDMEPDDFKQADEAFKKATEINSLEVEAWKGWGNLYLQEWHSNCSTSVLTPCLTKLICAYELDPNCTTTLLRLGEIYLIIASEKESLEHLHLAEASFNLAVKNDPKNSDTWHWYGVCLNELGRYFSSEKHYHRALEKFEQGLRLSPSNLLLLHGKATTYFALGDIKNSIEELEKSICCYQEMIKQEENMPPELLIDWGITLMRLGELSQDKSSIEASIQKFDKAVGMYLDAGEEIDIECLYNYGCALDYMGEFNDDMACYEKSLQILSHVVESIPEHSHALYHLGLAYLHCGEHSADIDHLSQAISIFQSLLEKDPEDDMAWNDCGTALLNLAVLTTNPIESTQSTFFFQEAEHHFHQAIALGNSNAFYNLACLYALMHNVSAAVHYLEKGEVSHTLPPPAILLEDEWLENIQNAPLFRQFISRLINKQSLG